MKIRSRIWLGLGIGLLAGTALSAAPQAEFRPPGFDPTVPGGAITPMAAPTPAPAPMVQTAQQNGDLSDDRGRVFQMVAP